MKPYELHHGDCLDVLKTLADCSVDAIVTDPPYGLGKAPDPVKVMTAWATQGYFEVQGKGFMGKKWDAFVPPPIVWKEVFRVLKPGGHLLAFAGTRTQDWMAMSLRFAGFEIRDMIFWCYGQGFPKSLDVSKAIDKAGGGESAHVQARRSLACEIREKREAAGVSRSQLAEWFPQYTAVTANWERTDAGFRIPSEDAYSELVRRLGIADNWRELVRAEDLRRLVSEGGQDRRDDGTVIGLGHSGREWESATEAAKQWEGWGTALKPALEPITLARKPLIGTVAANVLEHGTGGLNIDGCRVETNPEVDDPRLGGKGDWSSDKMAKNVYEGGYAGDRVGSSPLGRFPANLIHDGSEEVLALFPDSDGSGSARTLNRGQRDDGWGMADEPGLLRDAGSGSAARFFYCAKASKKDRGDDNKHPTVKPTDLMRYLCRLITPPNGIVLDPFMGSGSTGKAAILEGFRFVGIEREAEYIEFARARIDAAVGKSSDMLQFE
jgi:DNA modification methylase